MQIIVGVAGIGSHFRKDIDGVAGNMLCQIPWLFSSCTETSLLIRNYIFWTIVIIYESIKFSMYCIIDIDNT